MKTECHEHNNGLIVYRLPDWRWHREDGPAIISGDGSQFWYRFNKCHRLDGPAVIWANGTKVWWINGHDVTNEIKNWANEMNIDLDNLTNEDKIMIRLYWENYSK